MVLPHEIKIIFKKEPNLMLTREIKFGEKF